MMKDFLCLLFPNKKMSKFVRTHTKYHHIIKKNLFIHHNSKQSLKYTNNDDYSVKCKIMNGYGIGESEIILGMFIFLPPDQSVAQIRYPNNKTI